MINNPYAPIDDEEAAPIAPLVVPDPISSDRGEPTTKAPKKKKTGVVIAIVGVIIFTLFAVGMFGYFFYNAVTKASSESIEVASDPALETVATVAVDIGRLQDKLKSEEQQRQEAQAEEERAAAENASTTTNDATATTPNGAPDRGQFASQDNSNSGNGSGEKVLTPKEQAELRRFDGEVLWTGDGDSGGAEGQQRDAPMTPEERYRAMTQANNLGGDASGNSADSIGGLLETETFPNGTVFARPDLKFLLINGTSIPCTLRPRIVTDHPAGISCMVNRDVYSANGSILLIAKGSVARGERKVAIRPGQTTVFAAWSDIETTDGLKINIDSMAADGLGAAGINAVIDNHYGERFGGAILLSFLDDVFEAVAQKNSNSEGMNFDNSTQNAQDMSAIALENSINIPPTGYVQHATELNIIVARDIDFRSIYGVN